MFYNYRGYLHVFSTSSEKAMATHCSTLAWKIPWMEEPGRLQSMGSLGVRHDWATSLSLFTFTHWRRKWQPTPVFLPGESQGRGSLVGCRLWDHRIGHDWSDLAAAWVYLVGGKPLKFGLLVTAARFALTDPEISTALSLSLSVSSLQTAPSAYSYFLLLHSTDLDEATPTLE